MQCDLNQNVAQKKITLICFYPKFVSLKASWGFLSLEFMEGGDGVCCGLKKVRWAGWQGIWDMLRRKLEGSETPHGEIVISQSN